MYHFCPQFALSRTLEFLCVQNLILSFNIHSSLLSLVTEPHTLACYIYRGGGMGRRYGLTTCQIPLWGFPGAVVKNLPVNAGVQVWSWIGKIFWRRNGQPTPVFLPGKFYGQRSLWRAAVCGSQRVRRDSAQHSRFPCKTGWAI